MTDDPRLIAVTSYLRDMLVKRGASADEIASHDRALHRVRARLAELIREPGLQLAA